MVIGITIPKMRPILVPELLLGKDIVPPFISISEYNIEKPAIVDPFFSKFCKFEYWSWYESVDSLCDDIWPVIFTEPYLISVTIIGAIVLYCRLLANWVKRR